jgi:sporulation protein YlmC with PRC-barrel domain
MDTTTTNRTNRHAFPATKLLGENVLDKKGDRLGKVEDLAIDFEQGRVRYAILSFGGFLGMGEKRFAVPIQALQRFRGRRSAAPERRQREAEERARDRQRRVAGLRRRAVRHERLQVLRLRAVLELTGPPRAGESAKTGDFVAVPHRGAARRPIF